MATVTEGVPPLASGDMLARDEFLRRWAAVPSLKRAELIGGIVSMPSPVSVGHGSIEGGLGGWAWYYEAHTPGTGSGHNTPTLMLEDAPQPDVYLRIPSEYGGRARVEGSYLAGAPEWVGEACLSSAAYDLHQKLDLYQRAGVQEYLAVLLYDREVRWHQLRGGRYELLAPGADGLLRSVVFPGLWLEPTALLAGETARVLAVLQQGIAAAEHAEFVQRLAPRRVP